MLKCLFPGLWARKAPATGGRRKAAVREAPQAERGRFAWPCPGTRGPTPLLKPSLGFPCSGAPAGQAPWPTLTPTSLPAPAPVGSALCALHGNPTHHFILDLKGLFPPLPTCGRHWVPLPGACWEPAWWSWPASIQSPTALGLRCGRSPSLMCCPRGPGTRVWPGRACEGLLLGLLGERIPLQGAAQLAALERGPASGPLAPLGRKVTSAMRMENRDKGNSGAQVPGVGSGPLAATAPGPVLYLVLVMAWAGVILRLLPRGMAFVVRKSDPFEERVALLALLGSEGPEVGDPM